MGSVSSITSAHTLRQASCAAGGCRRRAGGPAGRGRLRVAAWKPPAEQATQADEETDYYSILVCAGSVRPGSSC